METPHVATGDGPGRFGPNTAEVERALTLGRIAAGWPPVMWFFSVHYEKDWVEAKPFWEQARSVAEANGLVGAYEAAYDEGYQTGYGSTNCAWEDSTFVTGFTAQALVVRHLLPPAVFDRLYHLWGDVFGPPSSATIEQEPPPWPPAVAFEPSCGARVCLHGAAHRQEKGRGRVGALIARIRGRNDA